MKLLRGLKTGCCSMWKMIFNSRKPMKLCVLNYAPPCQQSKSHFFTAPTEQQQGNPVNGVLWTLSQWGAVKGDKYVHASTVPGMGHLSNRSLSERWIIEHVRCPDASPLGHNVIFCFSQCPPRMPMQGK